MRDISYPLRSMQSGHLWTGDAYFNSGTASEIYYGRLARTTDQALYQHAAFTDRIRV